jgi:hypothetical protein
MFLRVALFVVSAASVVHAQAPGQAVPIQAPAPAPSVMDRRWAVSAGIGWESLTAKTEDGAKITFAMVDLAARFRIKPAFEIDLGLVAGGGKKDGDVTTSGLFVDGRYRFQAERAWNVFLEGGLGLVSVAPKVGVGGQKAARPALRIGVGVERRFTSFALFGQVRVVGVGENASLAVPPSELPAWQFSRYGLGGGNVAFGANLYF